jgi:hypothetical protein
MTRAGIRVKIIANVIRHHNSQPEISRLQDGWSPDNIAVAPRSASCGRPCTARNPNSYTLFYSDGQPHSLRDRKRDDRCYNDHNFDRHCYAACHHYAYSNSNILRHGDIDYCAYLHAGLGFHSQ